MVALVGTRFARALRRWVMLACALGTLVAIAAPAALGAALGPTMQLLGAEEHHACKCGMERGKCGCPECARLEHEHRREQLPDRVSSLRGPCDQGPAAIAFAALPLGVPAAAALLPVPDSERAPIFALTTTPSLRDREPPTPPPRLQRV